MSSGERPIGAAKGKQSDTEALCQPPLLPFQYLRLTAKILLRCLRCQEDLRLRNFQPAFGRGHKGAPGRRPPPLPLHTPPPPSSNTSLPPPHPPLPPRAPPYRALRYG